MLACEQSAKRPSGSNKGVLSKAKNLTAVRVKGFHLSDPIDNRPSVLSVRLLVNHALLLCPTRAVWFESMVAHWVGVPLIWQESMQHYSSLVLRYIAGEIRVQVNLDSRGSYNGCCIYFISGNRNRLLNVLERIRSLSTDFGCDTELTGHQSPN